MALATRFDAAFFVAAIFFVALATCFFATFLALATFFAIAFRLVFACFSTRSTMLELATAAAASLSPCCTFDPTAAVASSMESMAASTIVPARVCLRGIGAKSKSAMTSLRR